LTGSNTGNWILAAPPLFLAHEIEEHITALPWAEKHASIIPEFVRSAIPDSPAFIAYAGLLFLILFSVAGALALRSKPQSIAWMVLAILFTARLENAVLHTIESIVFMQYTPGVVTAILIVLPLTFYLMRRLVRLELIRRAWLPGIIVGGFIAQTAAIGAMLFLGAGIDR
jgi:hypothetical protein